MLIDPAWFRPDAVDPETARFNAELEQMLASAPTLMELGVPKVRQLRREGHGPLAGSPPSPRAENLTVAAEGREVGIRLIRPQGGEIRGAYLHIHGGAWCLGGADMQDPWLQLLADQLGIAALSVEYRLAPEHPFPAGPDDCEAAARWLLTAGADEFGTDRFAIGGESAGAHLAALTLLRLRDRPESTRAAPTGFLGASLVYGAFDLTQTPSVRRWGPRPLILSTPLIEWVTDRFVPPEQFPAERRRSAEVSPLHAQLDGMPPALFTVGTEDPLVDDTLMMAACWVAAGNAADLAVFPGGIHAFNAFPELAIAKRANQGQVEFIRRVLIS